MRGLYIATPTPAFYATAAAALSISWREMERAAAAAAEWPVSQEIQVALLE